MDDSDLEESSDQDCASGSDPPCPTSFMDEEEEGSDPDILQKRRNRTSFTPEQLKILEDAFQESRYPEAQQREAIAEATKLSEQKIQVWFSNRRARWRKNLGVPAMAASFAPFFIPGSFSSPHHPHTNVSMASPTMALPLPTSMWTPQLSAYQPVPSCFQLMAASPLKLSPDKPISGGITPISPCETTPPASVPLPAALWPAFSTK